MNKALNEGKLTVGRELAAEVSRYTTMYFETLTARNQQESTSNYIGTVGERLSLKVKVLGIFDAKIKMEDEAGNRLYTYTGIEAEKGQQLEIKATVMKHHEVVGIKTTYVNRVKLLA